MHCPKLLVTAMDSITAKLEKAVWRLTEDCNILCGRPAIC
ncbi:hypothetical protein AVDCRST_MAG84-6557 [uncultured Microcoleus sp.]|uniref:Uncharacterized protein n=1 Tax=uncultured Microcoleus sp. TaxID=259945 RepID=A0A6J4P9G1_9CYAN|nr:hypothetical protein AVDCRST_MAG84-6557 [uncultured Microcoleus sp.]